MSTLTDEKMSTLINEKISKANENKEEVADRIPKVRGFYIEDNNDLKLKKKIK